MRLLLLLSLAQCCRGLLPQCRGLPIAGAPGATAADRRVPPVAVSAAADAQFGREATFEVRVAELAAFRALHGHADPPLNCGPLSRWVKTQRRLYDAGKLSAAEIAALSACGLEWQTGPEDLDFAAMVERLCEYRSANGDSLVPKKYVPDPPLGRWVAWCRRRRLLLTEEERRSLDEAGFSWEPKRKCGSQFAVGLRAYMAAVEAGAEPDAQWSRAQREARSKGALSATRIEMLDGAGFAWEA